MAEIRDDYDALEALLLLKGKGFSAEQIIRAINEPIWQAAPQSGGTNGEDTLSSVDGQEDAEPESD